MITGSINLTALKSAVQEVPSKNGGKVKALIIPLEANYLEQHSNGSIYLNIAAWEKETQYSTHYITHNLKKDLREKLKAEGIQTPILGNLVVKNNETPQGAVNTDNSIADIGVGGDSGINPDDFPF